MSETKKKANPTTVVTKEFRVSFPDLYEARAMEDDDGKTGEAKYAVVMLFPKGTDLSAMKAAAQAAVVAKWGADKAKWPSNLRLPFRDQGEKDYEGYEAGSVFVRATSKRKPAVVGYDPSKALPEDEMYPGCYARAEVNAYTYDKKGNKGVAFGLNCLQKTRDGESLGGRSKPTEVFEPIVGALGADGEVDPFA